MNRFTSLGAALAVAAMFIAPADAKPKKGGGGGGKGKAPAAAKVKSAAPRAAAPRSMQRVAFSQPRAAAPRPKAKANVAARSSAMRTNIASQQRLSAQRNAASQRAAVVQRNTAQQRALTTQRNTASTRAFAVRQRQIGAQVERDRLGAVAEQRRDRDDDRWDRNNDRWDGDRRWDNDDRRSYYRPPYSVYRGWDRGRVHYWNSRPYHWLGGSWVFYDNYQPYDTTTVVYSGGSSGNLVDDVQSALINEGYDPGPVDGVMGSATRSAIAEYQEDHGLAVTGNINDSLLRSLGI